MSEIARISFGDEVLVAIVEHDPATRLALEQALEALGLRADHHKSPDSLLAKGRSQWAMACVSLGEHGLGILKQLREKHPRLPVLVLSPHPSVEWTVEAMRAGAADCFAKPPDRDRLRNAMARLLEQRAPAHPSEAIIGRSACMRELQAKIARAADSDVVVCLRGETGTGKELVARGIHERSRRRKGAFVAVNCAAIPTQLQESVFFGHERGSFTGAVSAHRGSFEQAHNGTLLLDELGEMSLATQAVLLRVLDERKVQRVGGTQEVPVNIRVICATHRNLEEEVVAGRFRQDLYYRLNVYQVDLPPLKQRLEDLPALVEYFLSHTAKGREPVPRMSEAALRVLSAHQWPGNVRELKNVVLSSALVCDGREIMPDNLPAAVRFATTRVEGTGDGAEPHLTFREIERRAILREIEASNGNVDKAARLLGLSRATVYRRLNGFAVASANSAPPRLASVSSGGRK